MIDTVCLQIPMRNVVFLDRENKTTPTWDLQARTEHYQKHIKNPTKRDKDSGLYFPRLTCYTRRGSEPSVKIEFSAPKLLFENNLQELSDQDFDHVVNALQDRLKRLGLSVFKKDIEEAKVSFVHFSKNILLKNGYTSRYLISELGKIDLRKSFDFARARYINDGQSLCAHTTSHELVVYDKISDLKKNQKRAIDKDQTAFQMSLFNEIRKQKQLIEVIRFEIRLCKKPKMNSILRQIGGVVDPNFKQVFSNQISQKVILNYWEGIIKAQNVGLFMIEMTQKDILHAIKNRHPTINPKQAIFLAGLVSLARDGNGLRELRSIVCADEKDRTWSRIKKDYTEIMEQISKNKTRDWVHQIDQAFKEYKPLTKIL
jgi:hypothetical protein